MLTPQIDRDAARDIIESLRSGIPPKRFVSSYSVGTEPFLRDVRRRHLDSPSSRGTIRFMSGHWGAGKTHVLRLLREEAFDAGYLVSSVELTVDQTPFHKFEQVFFDVVRNVYSPEMYRDGDVRRAAPFGEVLRRALFRDPADTGDTVSRERLERLTDALFADDGIDVDVRRVVAQYWATFLPDGGDRAAREDARGRILHWFSGEGGSAAYRSAFGVQKAVTRANARLMLESLSRFARHAGYRGLVILFDEAEMAYSVMRKSDLKLAHNNLLHLINSIDESDGAFLVYAATPDFFVDDRYGIVNYGALAQRIGRPELRAPSALDRVWNLDALSTAPESYVAAASKIREIYVLADPEAGARLPPERALRDHVAELVELHPEFSYISRWRVVITGTVRLLDRSAEGERPEPAPESYRDVMARLRAQ